MKRIQLFSLLVSALLLAGGCVNGSYHDYDSRHRPRRLRGTVPRRPRIIVHRRINGPYSARNTSPPHRRLHIPISGLTGRITGHNTPPLHEN